MKEGLPYPTPFDSTHVSACTYGAVPHGEQQHTALSLLQDGLTDHQHGGCCRRTHAAAWASRWTNLVLHTSHLQPKPHTSHCCPSAADPSRSLPECRPGCLTPPEFTGPARSLLPALCGRSTSHIILFSGPNTSTKDMLHKCQAKVVIRQAQNQNPVCLCVSAEKADP